MGGGDLIHLDQHYRAYQAYLINPTDQFREAPHPMGTRGAMIFVADGETKIIYNHYDSYPDELGRNILAWLTAALAPGELQGVLPEPLLRKAITSLVAVDEEGQPTPEQRKTFAEYTDKRVSDGLDWYSTLRFTQGDPQKTLRAGHYIEATTAWPRDSLFCEWGYVLDFDARELEVYKGFQTEPHTAGRFAELGPADETPAAFSQSVYYPIRLIVSFPFDQLPTEDEFFASIELERVVTIQAALDEETVTP